MVVQMGEYVEEPMSEIERPTGGVFDDPLATRINRKYRQVESLASSTVEAAI